MSVLISAIVMIVNRPAIRIYTICINTPVQIYRKFHLQNFCIVNQHQHEIIFIINVSPSRLLQDAINNHGKQAIGNRVIEVVLYKEDFLCSFFTLQKLKFFRY